MGQEQSINHTATATTTYYKRVVEESYMYNEVKLRVTPKEHCVPETSVPNQSRVYFQRMQPLVFEDMMKKQRARGNTVVQLETQHRLTEHQFVECH